MAAVRCPKCGTLNLHGHRRSARCARCHEALGKCRYCEHYDFRIADCANPARRSDERVLDADEALDCPEFLSALTSRGTAAAGRRPASRRWWLAVVTVALGGAAATFAMRSLGRAPETKWASVRVGVEAPDSIVQDEGLTVTVIVANVGEEPARDLRVVLSGRSLPWLVCQYVDPEECFLEASPRAVAAALGDLPPGGIRSVGFRFLVRRAGELRLAAHVTAANLEMPAKRPVECEVLP